MFELCALVQLCQPRHLAAFALPLLRVLPVAVVQCVIEAAAKLSLDFSFAIDSPVL
jgi:hypothetical protein